MNLFNKIPDNFFSILSSKNKHIYGLALVTLYETLILYHNKIRKSDYIDLLKSRGEEEIASLIIEEDDYNDDLNLTYEPTLAGKANMIVRRLVDTGWIVLDSDIKTGCEYILIPSYSISMLKLVYELLQDNEAKYVSYVHSTYADLQMEDENQDEFMYRTLLNAYNKTRDLELEVTKLDHSIRVFHKQLGNIFSPNEVLTQHFDIAREDVVDPIYHPLKTNDSIILFNGPISTILKRWLNYDEVREKLITQALSLNHQLKTRDEAEKDIIKKINYIQDTYQKLANEMEDIDVAQSSYTKATTEKIVYLNNSDKSIKGKLETIFLAIAREVNREDGGRGGRELAKSLTNSIQLYQQGYIDSDSLTKPYKRSERFDGDPMMLDDFEHELDPGIIEGIMGTAAKYSDEAILDFMDRAFKDNKEINIKDIPIKDAEDFIMVILGTVKSDSRDSFYNFVRPEPLERVLKEEKYDMPNYHYERKGE